MAHGVQYAHYIVPDNDVLRNAMEKFTQWLDDKIAQVLANVNQSVDREKKRG